MSKVALKTKIRNQQNGKCAISAESLAKETFLFDTDRIDPKANGGTYTDENTRGLSPRTHMERHNILKIRTPELTELKVLIDGREHIRKFMNSLNNRLLAAKRQTDEMDQITEKWIKEQLKEVKKQMGIQERRIDKFIRKLDIPVVKSMIGLKGLGTMGRAS